MVISTMMMLQPLTAVTATRPKSLEVVYGVVNSKRSALESFLNVPIALHAMKYAFIPLKTQRKDKALRVGSTSIMAPA